MEILFSGNIIDTFQTTTKAGTDLHTATCAHTESIVRDLLALIAHTIVSYRKQSVIVALFIIKSE